MNTPAKTLIGYWESYYLGTIAEDHERGLKSVDPKVREDWSYRVDNARINFYHGAFAVLVCLQHGGDHEALINEVNKWRDNITGPFDAEQR